MTLVGGIQHRRIEYGRNHVNDGQFLGNDHFNIGASMTLNHPRRRLTRYCYFQKSRAAKVSEEFVLISFGEMCQHSSRFVRADFHSRSGANKLFRKLI